MRLVNQIAGLFNEQYLQNELIHVSDFCGGNKYARKEESDINIFG